MFVQEPKMKKNQSMLMPLSIAVMLGFGAFMIFVSSLLPGKVMNEKARAAETSALQTASRYNFGTLMTDPGRAQQEKDAGVDTAMLEFGWDNYEPTDGGFSASNIDEQRRKIQTYRTAGQEITLAFSTHYTPGWVYNYANSKYINQYGVFTTRPNIIFNQILRNKMQEYMQNIVTNLGINNFTNIRITSGSDPEAMYPGMTDSQGHTGSYWAFDANAQSNLQADRPPSIPPNPMPGWRPGQTTYNGQSVTNAMVEQWYTWYMRALTDSVNWQIQFFRNAGYTGKFQVLTPGMGTRVSGYNQAISAKLAPSGDQTMGRGAVWHKFYEYLPDKQNVVAYVSSMADNSGNNDLCQDTDANVSISDPQTGSWSATRWISYIADKYGIEKNGENPGFGDANGYGVQMMNITAAQMSACHMTGMYWAHDHNLYDGTSGITLNNYQNVITQYNPPTTPTTIPVTVTPAPLITVDDSVMGAAQNQFNYVGGWGHCTNCLSAGEYNSSNSWSNTANEYVTFLFIGVQIKYYAVKAGHHGIAAVSIDNGVETNVDLYSSTRQGDTLVYASPVLNYGNHTLKIRVSGTHNILSTDNYVAIDRVDVISSGTNPSPTPVLTLPPTATPTLIPTARPTTAPDTTPPTVSITYPTSGTVQRGRDTVIQAIANDNVGVTRVEFYVNNSLKCTDTTVAYICSWSVPSKPNVRYTIQARAYDAAGYYSNHTVTVTSN